MRFFISLPQIIIRQHVPDLPAPGFRVQAQTDVSEFIAVGKSVFAKHVTGIDPDLHLGDDVLVVDGDDRLLAIGKLALPPGYFPFLKNGTAVKVRKGLNSGKPKN